MRYGNRNSMGDAHTTHRSKENGFCASLEAEDVKRTVRKFELHKQLQRTENLVLRVAVLNGPSTNYDTGTCMLNDSTQRTPEPSNRCYKLLAD